MHSVTRFQRQFTGTSSATLRFWSPLPSPSETVVAMTKILRRPLFVISSAARNLRSLTFVRDDNPTFGDTTQSLKGEEFRIILHLKATALSEDEQVHDSYFFRSSSTSLMNFVIGS